MNQRPPAGPFEGPASNPQLCWWPLISRSSVMITRSFILAGTLILLISYGCTQHKVEVAPVEVKPIHITIDVNVKVDRALDDFFSDIDSAEEKIENKSTSPE